MKYCNLWLLPTALIFTFLISGCSNKIRQLSKTDVNQIFFVYDTTALRIPGNTFKVGIGAETRVKDSHNREHDTVLYTTGFKGGSLPWSNFNVKTFGCSFSNGKVTIPDQDWTDKGNIAIDVEIKEKPDKRVYTSIAKNYITGVKLIAQSAFHKAPGNEIKLGVVKTYDNYATEILKKKKDVDNYFSHCQVLVSGGQYKNGSFLISEDLNQIENHRVGVVARPVADPAFADTFNVLLDYVDNYEYNVYASSGTTGPSGRDGAYGISADCRKCNGGDGQNGESGYNGVPGEYGHNLQVNLDAYFDSLLATTLCYVNVYDEYTQQQKVYLVNPKGGTLNIATHGGDGGHGGRGGDGGRGGNGVDGKTYTKERIREEVVTDSTGRHTVKIVEHYTVTEPGGNGGYGGHGGYGGNGGFGGDGGNIMVYYTEVSRPFLSCLHLRSIGGSGGMGGFGGNGGLHGSGGSGNPSGADGKSGESGPSGVSGQSGNNGNIAFEKKRRN